MDTVGPVPLTGLVLAGGRSRRMGRDKATLVVDGEQLVDRVYRRLGEVCAEVWVASGDGRRLGSLPQLADAVADAGPLGGILAGLEAARTPLVAVVAVDMPHCDPGLLVELARRWRGEAVVAPLAAGRIEPLHAVWASAAAPALRRWLDAGERRVVTVAFRLGVRVVGVEEASFATNLNRPSDLG